MVESQPFHLHGYNFFVVGTGVGNFDPKKDPTKYNLIDPIERNIVGVPIGGWTAIQFKADNPGVWFFHCRLELHTGWGLKIIFLVEDGLGSIHNILPPPRIFQPANFCLYKWIVCTDFQFASCTSRKKRPRGSYTFKMEFLS